MFLFVFRSKPSPVIFCFYSFVKLSLFLFVFYVFICFSFKTLASPYDSESIRSMGFTASRAMSGSTSTLGHS